jgi:hypothetical protein
MDQFICGYTELIYVLAVTQYNNKCKIINVSKSGKIRHRVAFKGTVSYKTFHTHTQTVIPKQQISIDGFS